MRHYAERGYADFDPVRRFGHTIQGAFAWNDIPAEYIQSARAKKCLAGGRDAGLKYGVGVALRGSFGQTAGMGAASDDNKDCANKTTLAIFNAIAQQFYNRFIDINNPGSAVRLLPKLTPREKDVLAWVARGKSNNEVSDILRISPHYVREVLSNITRKYKTSSRVTASLIAVFHGEIDASDLIVRPRVRNGQG